MEPFQQQREPGENLEYTPAALARADELDIDLSYVPGTGSNGRITRDDVEAFAEKVPDGFEEATGVLPRDPQGGEPHGDQSAVPETENPVTERAPSPVRPKDDDCVHFRCSTNPNFNLQSHKLGGTIRFTDGYYETDDPAEIAALRACQSVEEVSDCTCGPGDACSECPE